MLPIQSRVIFQPPNLMTLPIATIGTNVRREELKMRASIFQNGKA